ncbi:hypothetical protein ACROYT_G044171 [Oculina patagonica]
MGNKPTLLSGGYSERLGFVRIEADAIPFFSLSSPSVTSDQSNKPCDLQTSAQATHTQTPVECNHIEQLLHNNTPGTCDEPLLPSQPIRIPARRWLPPADKLRKEHILAEYAANFEGLGCLGPPVHFTVKPDVTPIQMPIHRIPVAKIAAEKSALDKYEKVGIIEKVDEPTPWCWKEVIRETPRKVRICIDPSLTVIKAILRPIHQMPTLNEQLHKLCHAKCFSLVDMHEGFLHIPLDEESSRMNTIQTLFGRYRWRRLPFGISSAPEEFQMRLMAALEGLKGTICIVDDILVFGEGKDFTEAEQDHDRGFVALMERCLKESIKLNPTKLQFKQPEVKFMGNIITKNGMKATPTITTMPTPRNKASLQRFLGMANYLSPYCPNLSTTFRPLTALTQKDVPFSCIRRNHVHIKQAAPQPTLPMLDSTPLSHQEPLPTSRNSSMAPPTEETSNHTQPHVQTSLLQQPETENPTTNKTESSASHANTSNNAENPASKATQARPFGSTHLDPTPSPGITRT